MKRVGEMLPPIGSESSKKTSAPGKPQPHAECELCGGLGWISADVPVGHPQFGKLLPCPHRQAEASHAVSQKLWDALGPLKGLTFETFRIDGHEGHTLTSEQRNSLTSARDRLRKFSNSPSDWVLLQGGYGCGKTHLAAAVANALLSRGIPVLFVNVPDLLDYLRAAYSPSADGTYSERFSEVLASPILILDDLGTQNATPWAEEKLYQILNSRYIAKRPTIVTTNLDLDDFDPRLRSRLSDQELVRKIKIDAPDYRRVSIEQEQSSLSSLMHYRDKRFETFSTRPDLSRDEQSNLKDAGQLAKSFAIGLLDWKMAQYSQIWLMFTGGFGVGKTHLAAAIANYHVERGYSAMFVVVPDLLDHLRAAFSPDARTSFDQRFEEVRTTPLLILDDLGTESATPWAREKLYQLLNHRYVARKPTVITTSMLSDELDPRIRTRLLDETICKVFPVVVPSYRGGPPPEKAKPARAASTRRR